MDKYKPTWQAWINPAKLESEILILRPLVEDDFQALFDAASDPAIWEQHPQPKRYEFETFKKYFETIHKFEGALVIIDKNTEQIIGSSSFYEFNPEKKEIEIGYTFLKKEYWGGKYNFDLKKLMLDHAFKYVDRVTFHVGSQNIRSQKAVKKIGGVFDSEFIKKTPDGSEFINCTYKLEKSDFYKNILLNGPSHSSKETGQGSSFNRA